MDAFFFVWLDVIGNLLIFANNWVELVSIFKYWFSFNFFFLKLSASFEPDELLIRNIFGEFIDKNLGPSSISIFTGNSAISILDL